MSRVTGILDSHSTARRSDSSLANTSDYYDFKYYMLSELSSSQTGFKIKAKFF